MPTAVRTDALRHVALFCENHVPEHVRDEVRLEHSVRGSKITIVERRPPWSEHIGPEWTSMNIAHSAMTSALARARCTPPIATVAASFTTTVLFHVPRLSRTREQLFRD